MKAQPGYRQQHAKTQRESACCFTKLRCPRYTFGKPVTGKLTVNMTVNGVGYYRHEMGQPVVKSMDVSIPIIYPFTRK